MIRRDTRMHVLLTAFFTCVVCCAHPQATAPQQPLFSAEQQRARAGAWGGPEAQLSADALAYAASRAPWVMPFSQTQARPPKFCLKPLATTACVPELARAFDAALTQALINQGRFEMVPQGSDDKDTCDVVGEVSLTAQALQVEGQDATRFAVRLMLHQPETDAPVWEDEQSINKWTAKPLPDAIPAP